MTPGTDGTTIDGFSRKQISQLIELLKWERYQPKPVRRTYIPKKNGKMRPLGIPAFADKLVQEVVRQILEAIYEPIFSDNSHGFRPIAECKALALYDTGVTAEYGDKLITLSTCEYSRTNGRMVVVAKLLDA